MPKNTAALTDPGGTRVVGSVGVTRMGGTMDRWVGQIPQSECCTITWIAALRRDDIPSNGTSAPRRGDTPSNVTSAPRRGDVPSNVTSAPRRGDTPSNDTSALRRGDTPSNVTSALSPCGYYMVPPPSSVTCTWPRDGS